VLYLRKFLVFRTLRSSFVQLLHRVSLKRSSSAHRSSMFMLRPPYAIQYVQQCSKFIPDGRDLSARDVHRGLQDLGRTLHIEAYSWNRIKGRTRTLGQASFRDVGSLASGTRPRMSQWLLISVLLPMNWRHWMFANTIKILAGLSNGP